jgi:hypothetical protein
MNTLFIRKGGFTFSPEFNYGSDGKPWTVNQWFRYQWHKGKFTIMSSNFSYKILGLIMIPSCCTVSIRFA